MVIMVKKADGSMQPSDKAKIVKTCLRSGANREIAEEIAENIEAKAYNGIETEKILDMIFRYLRKHRPIIKHFVDLRKRLSMLQSKPDFERFVQIVLGENGYKVSSNQIIRGRCVEHEVDAIACKDGVTYYVEAKHHSNYHTPTGLDESRIARAVLEDVKEGRELGLNSLESTVIKKTGPRIHKPSRIHKRCNKKLHKTAQQNNLRIEENNSFKSKDIYLILRDRLKRLILNLDFCRFIYQRFS